MGKETLKLEEHAPDPTATAKTSDPAGMTKRLLESFIGRDLVARQRGVVQLQTSAEDAADSRTSSIPAGAPPCHRMPGGQKTEAAQPSLRRFF